MTSTLRRSYALNRWSAPASTKTAIAKANMNRIGAVAVLMFPGKGVYKFTTKPGEDYKGMAMHTIGEDNVLRLTVVVR